MTPAERAAAKTKLSSVALIREAATQIYEHRVALALAVILPILCSQALRMSCVAYVCAGDEPPSTLVYFSVMLARLPFYVMFATICHRVVLMGSDALPSRWGLFWSARETKFLGWLFVLGLIAFVLLQPIYYSLLVLPLNLLPMDDKLWFLTWAWPVGVLLVCLVPATYIDGRLGLVLPATAIGKRLNPLKSWKATTRNSGAIFLALLVPTLVVEVIDFLLFGLLIRTDSLVLTFLRGLLYYPLFAVGIVIITIAYRQLVLSREDPEYSGDPPITPSR